MDDVHIRQQALDAAVAKLAAGVSLVGGRVWLGPRSAFAKKELPALLVLQGEERAEYVSEAGRILRRDTEFDVLVVDSIEPTGAVSHLMKSVNAIALQVEKTLVPASIDGQGLGIGEMDLRYLGTERPAASAMGEDAAEMAVKFRVALPSVEGEPGISSNTDPD